MSTLVTLTLQQRHKNFLCIIIFSLKNILGFRSALQILQEIIVLKTSFASKKKNFNRIRYLKYTIFKVFKLNINYKSLKFKVNKIISIIKYYSYI